MKKKLKPYPGCVCYDCGIKASKGRSFICSTYHQDKCDVCGKETACTQPRDFLYPKFKGHEV